MHQSTPTTNPKDVDRSCFTGMAQRQRARLITARSHDRNVLPVFIFTSQWCIKALEQTCYRCGAEEARCKTPSSHSLTFSLI